MSSLRVHASDNLSSVRLGLVIAGLLCATTLAGCSADLGRFDMASASFNSDATRNRGPVPSEPLRRSNAGVPVAAEAPPAPYTYSPTPYEPAPAGPVRMAGLPEPVSRDGAPARTTEPLRPAEPRHTAPSPARDPAPVTDDAQRPPAGGTTIEVRQGDTVYALAKRHRVSISEMMSANNLQTPMIRPGQKLIVPSSHRAAPARRNRKIATAPPVQVPTAPGLPSPAKVPAPAGASEPPPDWTGTHTVSPRDSLSTIARRYNVKVAELQSANGITDPTRLRAGTVLKVPSALAAAAPQPADATPAPPIGPPTIINAQTEPETSPGSQPERVAAVAPRNPVLNDASPAPERAAPLKPQPAALPSKFRWPVKGRVIANFGPRSDNSHNDGINILVPQGTSVMAAESGTVAYAGSELKGYGNLVLIRHEGNWVSAYAHNDTLLVKRGDKVERGQAVAKAGKTGAVDQPQVHFELRQGSRPVDPMPHLEK